VTPPNPMTCDSLAATLAPAEAAATPWHVVIVGGGPAGSAAAIRLARRGLRVLLVDRDTMPRWKVCGCCLSATALGELRMLGFEDATRQPLLAIRLKTVRVVAARHATRLPLPDGAALSREALDRALVRRAIDAGCDWLPHTNVTAIDERSSPGKVLIATGSSARAATEQAELAAEYCILATGLADHVRIRSPATDGARHSELVRAEREVARDSRIGLGAMLAADASDLPSSELLMAVSRSGYCGLVRLADGGIDLAAAVDRAALAGPTGPGGAVWSILNEAEGDIGRLRMSEQAIRTAEFRATPPLTHASALVAGATGRMLRAGDAAAYVEPFTGEGIGWALTSGRIVADAVLARSPQGSATLCSPIEVATRYRVDHRQHFQPLHDRCRRVSIALRRPAVVAAAMHAARIAPWAARRLMPALIGSHVAEASCS
jgi:flavin-dependent dehydrogenase